MRPLISVIVPVYNAEKYLVSCLDSIRAQIFSRWETILVNDGSTDNSGIICDKYAIKDSRFIVLHQENQGASAARNTGIDQAKGEWITFIDADDYIDKDYLEILSKYTNTYSETLVIQGLKQVTEEGIKNCIEFTNKELSGHYISVAFDELRIFEHGYSVAKLYNREIISRNHIQFNNKISYSEDLLFMLEYLLYCNSIRFIEGVGYNYVVSASCLSQRYNSFESEYRLFKKYDKLNNEVAQKFSFEPTESSLRNGALLLMRSLYSIYINKEMAKRERLNTINSIKMKYHNYIKEYYKPQILLFRLIKSAFFMHPLVFDTICRIKFR